jgi:hypothetical protein
MSMCSKEYTFPMSLLLGYIFLKSEILFLEPVHSLNACYERLERVRKKLFILIGNSLWILAVEVVVLLLPIRVKVKLSRYRHAVAKWESKCSSYSFSTSALDGGG